MEVLKVDRKERAVIPAHVRRGLGIRRAVKARVEEGRLIIEPLEDPVEALMRLVERQRSTSSVR